MDIKSGEADFIYPFPKVAVFFKSLIKAYKIADRFLTLEDMVVQFSNHERFWNSNDSVLICPEYPNKLQKNAAFPL